MNWHDHPDAADLARRHWPDCQASLIAQRDPCILEDELAAIAGNRAVTGGLPEDLDAWKRPVSWFIAVLVCPGDDLLPLVPYVVDRGLDADRVHFYLHADAGREPLRPWAKAGLPLDHVDDEDQRGRPLCEWKGLHQIMGLHLNRRIVDDARP